MFKIVDMDLNGEARIHVLYSDWSSEMFSS